MLIYGNLANYHAHQCHVGRLYELSQLSSNNFKSLAASQDRLALLYVRCLMNYGLILCFSIMYFGPSPPTLGFGDE